MRTTLKRALVAGAVAVTVAVPIGAFAAVDDANQTSASWSPHGQCDAPENVRAALDSPEITALQDEHRAEVTALREEHRANQDPDSRESFRASMTTLRDEHRTEIIAALESMGESDAAAWLQEHWSTMQGGQGFGQGRGGQGFGGGFRHTSS